MKSFDVEERVALAANHFASGYNCAQSVLLAYADLFDLDMETAKRMSVSFGGGMSRLREVCGTVSGMAMLAGLRYPVDDPHDQQARTQNYAIMQRMAAIFREQHGAIVCRELLSKKDAAATSPAPSLRTPQYYSSRPCGRLVEDAARIAGSMILGELEDK